MSTGLGPPGSLGLGEGSCSSPRLHCPAHGNSGGPRHVFIPFHPMSHPHWLDHWPTYYMTQAGLKFCSVFSSQLGLPKHGQITPGRQLPAASCGYFRFLPEVLLCGLVVLQLLLDALKLSLQVSVAHGNRRISLILVLTLPAGPRLNGGSPGACCAMRSQVHTCSFGAKLRPGACEVLR